MASTAAEAGTEQESRRPSRSSSARNLLEWVVVIVGAILVALVMRAFVIQVFYIPSESMEPALQIGDRVLVNKLAYRFGEVDQGQIVVFERPDNEQSEIPDLIKRVVATGGQTVVIQDGDVWVDGKPLDEPYLPAGTVSTNGPGTSSYPHTCTPQDPCVIPEGSVWVMGDNRSNSRDSRYFGPVAEERIVGRAFAVVWPFSDFSGI